MKRHILSYPKIIVSNIPPAVGGGRVSIPGPWTNRQKDKYRTERPTDRQAETDNVTDRQIG